MTIHTDLYTCPYKRGVINRIGLYEYIVRTIRFFGIPKGCVVTYLGSDIHLKGIPFYLENIIKKIRTRCPQCIED